MTTITLRTEPETLSDGSEVYNLVFRDVDEEGAPEVMRLSAVDFDSAMKIEDALLGNVVDLDILQAAV